MTFETSETIELFLLLPVFLFAMTRLLVLCQFFQQGEYDGRRFLKLVFGQGQLIDKKASLFLLLMIPLSLFLPLWGMLIVLTVGLVGFSVWHINFIRTAKKPLVFTARAKRILGIAFLWTVIGFVFLYHSPFVVSVIVLAQALPFVLVLGNITLIPYEKWTQKQYYDEAVTKLNKLKPTVIGVTGSYGKTSVKHILAHILSQAAPTLATPGSVNTVMGITRIIREQLDETHRYFIAEMAAYGPGSIKRLCDFCQPDHGILTAVGDMHYERFKDRETVARAKFELWDAVNEKNGFFVINGTQVENKFIQRHVGKKPLATVTVVDDVRDVTITAEGLSFTLSIEGEDQAIQAPLYGRHQVTNIALAVVFAHRLGVPMTTITAALKTTPQITHRLEVKKHHDGPDVVDDAYNSNPEGFASALSVLDILGQDKGGRRILVTPGMLELGALHGVKHTEIGEKAAEICDVIITVRGDRFPSFEQAVKAHQGQRDIEMINCDSFAEAKDWLTQNAKQTDVILYENDLSDLYESTVNL